MKSYHSTFQSRLRWLVNTAASAALLAGMAACNDDPASELGNSPELAGAASQILDAHLARQEFPGAVMAVQDPALGGALVASGNTRPGPEGPPVDADVPWAIGSATKMFVAVTVLQLAEGGQVELDASIEPFFPDLPRASEITVRELLQHTSGLNEYIESPAVTSDAQRNWSAEELIGVAVANGPVAEPGSGHHYANTNYIVLGELIEKVTGRPWYEEVHRRILGPLGMRHTHYAGEAGAPRMGSGFAGQDGMFVDATTSMDASVGGAAGALQSTASDLMRFARELRDGGLLGAQQQMDLRSFIPAEPRGYVRHEYGLGFEKYVVNDVTIYGHAGTAPAHGAFVGFADTGLAITVMVNVSNPASAPLMTLEAVGAITQRNVSPPAETSPPASAP